MEQFNLGNSLYVDEDFEAAIEAYTKCLEFDGNSQSEKASIYSHRAACYIKLKNFAKAKLDSESALLLKSDYEPALYRFGLSSFELKEYLTSQRHLQKGLSLNPKARIADYERLLRKCEAEIRGDVIQPATDPDISSSPVVSPSENSTNLQVARTPVIVPKVAIRYEYYQSTERLCISVLAKNLVPSQVDVKIESNHLFVRVRRDDCDEVVIDKQLYGTIDVSKSSYEIRKPKIEINLHKIEHFNWPSIEGSAAATVATAVAPAVPVGRTSDAFPSAEVTSNSLPKPYATKKDWNRVGSSIEKELESEKPEGEEALHKLFRDIYEKADEDTRRAMNKSFQTSGGTVLSTNWSDVGKKNYEKERQAPKGVEWRNWEGEKIKQEDS